MTSRDNLKHVIEAVDEARFCLSTIWLQCYPYVSPNWSLNDTQLVPTRNEFNDSSKFFCASEGYPDAMEIVIQNQPTTLNMGGMALYIVLAGVANLDRLLDSIQTHCIRFNVEFKIQLVVIWIKKRNMAALCNVIQSKQTFKPEVSGALTTQPNLLVDDDYIDRLSILPTYYSSFYRANIDASVGTGPDGWWVFNQMRRLYTNVHLIALASKELPEPYLVQIMFEGVREPNSRYYKLNAQCTMIFDRGCMLIPQLWPLYRMHCHSFRRLHESRRRLSEGMRSMMISTQAQTNTATNTPREH